MVKFPPSRMNDLPPQPHAVGYREAPFGDVAATEAAVAALARSRSWATMAAVVLLAGGGMASVGGTVLIALYALFYGDPNWGDVTPVNLVLGGIGLLYGIPLLIAGVLLLRFALAAGRTNALRRPEDLERALAMLLWFWRVAALLLLALLVSPFLIFSLTMVTGAWD